MEGGDGGDWEGEEGIVNQVLFGDVLIDTDDIYFSRIDEGAETFGGTCYTCVMFKHGQGERLEGEAKAAFDEWAATLPRVGERADERREGEQDDDVHGWTPPPEARRLVDTEPRYGTGRVKPEQQGRTT